jgi:flagellin
MTRINTNVSSLVAQNTLGRSNSALNQALTRLSTGLRINTGKDDPAGLIASENLRSDITSIKKAITNTDRANQVIATADSALGQVSGLLNDIRGLVTEAANTGALSDEQIAANQLQVDSSLEALNRIAQTTTFQGRRLLDGSLDFITTAGNGFSTVTDLKIDQANLGATGQVAVTVDITTAATQATISNTAIPSGSGSGVQASGALVFNDPAVPSTGTLAFSAVSTPATAGTGSTTFTVETVAEVLASGTSAVLANGGTLTVTAVSGGIAGGATGNTFDLDLIDGNGNPSGVDSVVLNGTTIEVTADLTSGAVDLNAIVSAIDGHDFGSGVGNDFDASATLGGSFAVVGDAAAPRLALASGVTQVTQNAQLDITADAALGAGSTTVNFVFGTPTSGNVSITGSVEGTLTVTLNDDGTAFQLDEIAAALTAYTGIDTASFVSNGTLTIDNDNDSAPSAATVTGGTNAASTTQTINITGVDGDASNINFQVVESAAVLTSTPVVSGDAQNGYVISVSSTVNTTVASIANAIQGLAEVATASYAGSATYDVSLNTGLTSSGITTSLIGGLDTADDVITITADTAGTAPNGVVSVSIIEATSHGTTPTAAFNGGNIEVTVDDAANTSVNAIVAAINDLAGYSATLTSGAGDDIYAGGVDLVSPVTLNNGANPGGLDSAVVLEISGTNGAEVLSFGAGSSLTQIVAGINGVSDATGVLATNDSGNLVLTSQGYGSAALVSVNVLDGDANDTFKNGLNTNRDIGTDIVATVNGIAATGTGNKLYVNTATLDLTIAVDAGSSTDVNFTIAGGGALFQLGPDVVSNQQARIGITSVNTAKLGGVSGKLFQLGSGGTAALVDDTNTAGAIVEEAINQITSLRGRLGAFQRTTLETNKQALNDTLVNLTEAESQIRDSDFAEETAALTRAQILVQSGTTVLQITNQNPQNVLALLR